MMSIGGGVLVRLLAVLALCKVGGSRVANNAASYSSNGKCMLQKSKRCRRQHLRERADPWPGGLIRFSGRKNEHASLLQRAKRVKDIAVLQVNETAASPPGQACGVSVVSWWASKLFGGIWADPCQASADLLWLSEVDFVQQPDTPANQRDLFFRPVSVTLYCVMWLTMQSIVVHSGVAVARNGDELSAALEPSFTTQVLETAARSVPLAPVMSLLFLANRIYMLESTNGLGEVEWWVKLCMLTSVLGMTWQLVTVVLLGLTTVRTSIPFSEVGGDARDAHPHILRYQFRGPIARAVCLVLQGKSMLAIYGGVTGVIVGMAFSGRGVDPKSAAVCCTAAIVAIYFAIQFSLWATNTGLLPSKMDKYEKAVRQAAVRCDSIVQKAPMFAVLVLSTRLRQVKEATPGGTPHQFLVACFATVAVSLYVEVILCPFTRGVLDDSAEDLEEETKDGASVASGPSLRTRILDWVQALVAILGLSAASVIASSIVTPWVDGEALLMSPTTHSVMALCLVFFLVHLLITLYGLARSHLRLTSSRAQDALLAARNSVGFCPLLCTLFLGCRMRALQITANKGMPQWWEQDFLYLCVSATVIEVLCCITVPAFYKEVGVDSEGNQTYDIQSVTGAYIVTVVRYLGLVGMYGGIAGICLSVMTMTPDNATGVRPGASEDVKSIARTMLWTLVGLMLACLLSSAKVVGLIVKLAIESVDEMLLGAEINVDTAVLSLSRGQVVIKGLVIKNPSGPVAYKSAFLLKVGIASVKINLWRIIFSLARDIQIGELLLNGVELNYELGSAGGKSNVGALMDFLEGQPDQIAAAAAASPTAATPKPPEKKESFLQRMQKSASSVFVGSPKDEAAKPPPPPPAPSRAVVLKRILIKDVHAKVLHPSMGALVNVDLGNMHIQDFSKQSKGRQVGDIVVFVLKTVIRTAMANADIVKSLLQQGTSHVISSVAEKVKLCGQGCGAPCFSAPSREPRGGSSSSS